MLLAGCVLIQCQDVRILANLRPGETDDMGLIGGGVEPEDGELVADRAGTPRWAVSRQRLDNAGISVWSEPLVPIFEGVGRTCWAVIFCLQGSLSAPVLGDNPEGVVRWVEPAAIMRGRFAEDNRALLAALQREASD